MTGSFNWLMRNMPQILCVVAVVMYASTIVTGIAAGEDIANLGRDGLSTSLKLRTLVILFVQPLMGPMVALFGAALLWRMDRWPTRSAGPDA